MIFKQALLDDLLHTYTAAEELRIYEDRLKQWVSVCIRDAGGGR